MLRRLRRIGSGLVLATSKTAAEVLPLRDEIGFSDWPAIVENGGGILEPGADAVTEKYTYQELQSRIWRLPKGFRGFGDMSAAEIAQVTGLSCDNAEAAKARQFTEPGLWTGPEDQLPTFLNAAEKAGLTARRGGRFLTLSLGGTKADRMDEIIRTYAPRYTVALGDAPNDVEMLQHAELGVIVKNGAAPELPTLPGEATGRIRRTEKEGAAGWAEAVSALIDELTNNGNDNEERAAHG